MLNEAKEAGVEVDPATHDAVIAALGKVCAVTHALLRSKGSEATGAPVFFPPRSTALCIVRCSTAAYS